RQHETRTELAEWTASIHERRRVRFEATLRHQEIELPCDAFDGRIARAIAPVSFRNHGRNAPEQILRLLDRLSSFVLHQVALSENGARVGGERDGTGGWVDGKRHGDRTPQGFDRRRQSARKVDRRVSCNGSNNGATLLAIAYTRAAV